MGVRHEIIFIPIPEAQADSDHQADAKKEAKKGRAERGLFLVMLMMGPAHGMAIR
jgi:hypothetical protein